MQSPVPHSRPLTQHGPLTGSRPRPPGYTPTPPGTAAAHDTRRSADTHHWAHSRHLISTEAVPENCGSNKDVAGVVCAGLHPAVTETWLKSYPVRQLGTNFFSTAKRSPRCCLILPRTVHIPWPVIFCGPARWPENLNRNATRLSGCLPNNNSISETFHQTVRESVAVVLIGSADQRLEEPLADLRPFAGRLTTCRRCRRCRPSVAAVAAVPPSLPSLRRCRRCRPSVAAVAAVAAVGEADTAAVGRGRRRLTTLGGRRRRRPSVGGDDSLSCATTRRRPTAARQTSSGAENDQIRREEEVYRRGTKRNKEWCEGGRSGFCCYRGFLL